MTGEFQCGPSLLGLPPLRGKGHVPETGGTRVKTSKSTGLSVKWDRRYSPPVKRRGGGDEPTRQVSTDKTGVVYGFSSDG